MKTAYHYDYETKVFTCSSEEQTIEGYEVPILAQFATWIAPPEFNPEIEHVHFDEENQVWVKRDNFVEVTAYCKATHQEKKFDDASLVTDDHTFTKPESKYHTFDGENDCWTISQEDLNNQKIQAEKFWCQSEYDAEKENYFKHEIGHSSATSTQAQVTAYLNALLDYQADDDAMLAEMRPNKPT